MALLGRRRANRDPDRLTTARAEAQARANHIRQLHAGTVAVVAVGLVVTAGLVVGSWVVDDRNEDRLLGQRSHEAAAVAGSSIGGLQGQLAAAGVAAATDDASFARFRQLIGPTVGPNKAFVSASVWPLDTQDAQPSLVIGAAPLLQGQDAEARRAFLTSVAGQTTFSIRDFLEAGERRLGYAYALPGGTNVVYLESVLPKNRRARIASDSAFADLDYALYLGDHARQTHLLASSSGHGLSGMRTATDKVPFGNSSLLLVVGTRAQLGGDLLARLPWILAGLGLVLTFAAAFLTERLARRRERAEELSDRLEEVAEENAALFESQRQVAEQLQRSLMPRSLPQFDGLHAAGRYVAGVAGTQVGGDWYDVVPLPDNRLAFSVGDVCGRGLSAAALMASLRYSIRAYALERSDPATILAKLSSVMEHTTVDTFATMICGTIDRTSGTLTVARAGHPDLLAVDSTGAHYVDAANGPPIGVQPDWVYRSTTLALDDEVILLAFTDGLVERRRESIDVGLERLRVAAETDLPIEQLVPYLVDSLTIPDTDDDIALLGLHWTPAAVATATLGLPATVEACREAREFLRGALQTWALDGIGDVVELLTAELVTNVVRHVGSPMELRVLRRASSIRIEVDDASSEVPILRNPDPTMEYGRGVLLVDSLATTWGVDQRAAGKTVWFELDLDAPPQLEAR